MKFSIKDLFSICDQIRSVLRIWSRLLKKYLMVFCASHPQHLPLPFLTNFFYCCSQRRYIINVFSHYTILADFQFNCSILEKKRTEAIGFFLICTTKMIELEFFLIGWGKGEGYCGSLNSGKQNEDGKNSSLYAFHFSH